MDMRSRCSAILGLVVLLACGARAADDTSCLAQLAACGSYLNSTTKPDKSCCNPLVTVIEKDPQCLCGLLTGGTVKQLGVNVTRALELPVECGKNVSATQCSKTSGGSSPAGGSGGGSRNTSSAGPSTSSDKSDAKAASGRSSAEIIQAVTFGLAVAALQIFTVDFHGLH